MVRWFRRCDGPPSQEVAVSLLWFPCLPIYFAARISQILEDRRNR
ncbi:hypothetical protein SEA_GUDMIT_69 [Gordonia phage Gudmit]|nr:hypothetical protein SEA_GUDMIT_69 [Gordonia phage Gudmit]